MLPTATMSTGSIDNLSAGAYLQSLIGSAVQGSASAASSTAGGGLAGILASSGAQGSDHGGLSPFAQLVSILQQLQQSNPAQYQQVTRQIASKLSTAAQTAQSQGNTARATELNQLANDFTSASKTGQSPNLQDLAQAAGGHHHRHHHGVSFESSPGESSATSETGEDPLSIIANALSTAGTAS